MLKGNLDASSKNLGYVLLMFYHLYDGKARNIKHIFFYSFRYSFLNFHLLQF
jgi:hypothetical protein